MDSLGFSLLSEEERKYLISQGYIFQHDIWGDEIVAPQNDQRFFQRARWTVDRLTKKKLAQFLPSSALDDQASTPSTCP